MINDNDTKTDDELLMQFFGENKHDIADAGFSDRVMRRLPQRARRLNQAWSTLCFAAAMALFLLFDGIAELRALAVNMMGNAVGYLSSIDLSSTSVLTTLAGVAALAVVWLYSVLSTQR